MMCLADERARTQGEIHQIKETIDDLWADHMAPILRRGSPLESAAKVILEKALSVGAGQTLGLLFPKAP
jgi:hypothetical protein